MPVVLRHVEGMLGTPQASPVTSEQAFDILLLAVPGNEENWDNTDETLIHLEPSKFTVRVMI